MGRRSLSGQPPRMRTVDDDLAASNLTRQDIAVGEYAFKRVWARLRAQGWYAKPGPPLSYDHFYIKPCKTLADGVEGVDYFYGEANLVTYGVSIHLFDNEGDGALASPSASAVAGADEAVHQEDTSAHARSNHVGRVNDHTQCRQTASTPAATSATLASSGATSKASPQVKAEGGAVKQEGDKGQSNGKNKLKSSAAVEPRQRPDSHRLKGGHAADAICIDLDSDDEENDQEDEEPKRPVNPGKRKAQRIFDEDVDDDEDGSSADDHGIDGGDDFSVGTVESDATGHSEASTATSATSKRPLLTTKGNKKQKVARGTKHTKAKSVRDILDDGPPNSSPPPAARAAEPTRNTPPASPGPPLEPLPSHPQPAAKPSVVNGSATHFNVTVKEEPLAYAPPTPPPRPPSRASSVASSQRSSSVPRNSDIETLLEVEGVAFPGRPSERYRLLITQHSGETTILMEERATLEQRQLTFTDITAFGTDPVPEHALRQALCRSLVTLSENAADEPASNDASSIDFVREESSASIVLLFPYSSLWTVTHRFPMEAVPEGPTVRALREELARVRRDFQASRVQLQTAQGDLETTREELRRNHAELHAVRVEAQAARDELETIRANLETAVRDRDALQKQHEQLDHEYQKLRAEKDLTRQAQVSPHAAPQPRTPSPSPPKARPKAHVLTPPRMQSPAQAKPSAKPRAQPPVQVKPTSSTPKAHSQEKPPAAHSKASSQLHAKQHKIPRREEKTQAQKPPPKSPSRAIASSVPSAVRTTTPVAAASSENEPRVFHAQSKWLDSTFPKCPEGSSWVVQWKKLVCVNRTHYTVVGEDGVSTEVKLNVSGSYQLTMVVSHVSTMLLNAVITTAGSGVRRVSFHPQLIQICPAASGPRYISHFNQTIHFSANDSIFAELRPCNESDPLSGKVERLEKFAPPANDWRIEWKQEHGHTNGSVNGK